MKVASLFSGVGGIDLAFERAGFEVAAQCEIDPYALAVLQRHWPTVRRFTDVRSVTGNELPAIDALVGGFPCQDLSVAGRREGLAGDRSGLWFEFHRVITETWPQWVVIENVPGLLSSNGGLDFAVVLGGLTGIIPEVPKGGWGNAGLARGRGELYGVAWRVLDSQYFGVPQRRRRVVIVGSLGDGRAAEVLFEREGLFGHPPARRKAGQEAAGQSAVGIDVRNCREQPDEVSGTLQAKKTGGYSLNYTNPIACQNTGQGYWNDKEVFEPRFARNGRGAPDEIVPPLKAESGSSGKGDGAPVIGFYPTGGTHGVSASDDLSPAVKVGSGIGIPSAPAIAFDARGHGDGAAVIAFAQNSRDEVRLQGGDGQVIVALAAEPGMKQTTYLAFDARSNGCHTPWDCESKRIYVEEGVAPTLAAASKTGGNTTPAVHFGGVRRLTPVECERLQGFPDGWTETGLYRKVNPQKLERDAAKGGVTVDYVIKAMSDSHRYRQMGNAVTVDVFEWLARRIAKVHRGF